MKLSFSTNHWGENSLNRCLDIAVTYGFGFTSREQAEKARPTYIAESVEQLEKILFGE